MSSAEPARGGKKADGSVVYTAWVLLVLGVLLPPLWLLLVLAGDGPRGARLVRACARAVVWLTRCPVRVTGIGHLKGARPLMLVANHASLADAAFLLAALPAEFSFVANHAHARYPILGLAIRRASHHIVDRSSWRGRAASGEAMIDALRSGTSLLVFPEGTTSEGGGLLPFRNGAFRAAARTGRPIVPIVIRGTDRLLPPSSSRLRRVPVHIDILPALHASGTERGDVAAIRDEAAQVIADRLQR